MRVFPHPELAAVFSDKDAIIISPYTFLFNPQRVQLQTLKKMLSFHSGNQRKKEKKTFKEMYLPPPSYAI